MPHFLISSADICNGIITVNDKELYKHIIKAMRYRRGDKILFIDENEIQHEAVISEVLNTSFSAEITASRLSERKLLLNLYIAQSVLNSDAQTSAVQKASEMGVKGIIPLYTDNCAVKEAVIKSKIEKWRKTALESVKQCERADIPEVFEISYIKDIVKNFDTVIVFAEKYTQMNFFEYVKKHPVDKNGSILLIIGPEGGFSEREFEFFKSENIPLITMGNLIYRADTALCAALNTVISGVLYV